MLSYEDNSVDNIVAVANGIKKCLKPRDIIVPVSSLTMDEQGRVYIGGEPHYINRHALSQILDKIAILSPTIVARHLDLDLPPDVKALAYNTMLRKYKSPNKHVKVKIVDVDTSGSLNPDRMTGVRLSVIRAVLNDKFPVVDTTDVVTMLNRHFDFGVDNHAATDGSHYHLATSIGKDIISDIPFYKSILISNSEVGDGSCHISCLYSSYDQEAKKLSNFNIHRFLYTDNYIKISHTVNFDRRVQRSIEDISALYERFRLALDKAMDFTISGDYIGKTLLDRLPNAHVVLQDDCTVLQLAVVNTVIQVMRSTIGYYGYITQNYDKFAQRICLGTMSFKDVLTEILLTNSSVSLYGLWQLFGGPLSHDPTWINSADRAHYKWVDSVRMIPDLTQDMVDTIVNRSIDETVAAHENRGT